MARKLARSTAVDLADLSLRDDELLPTTAAARLVGLTPKTLRCLRCERAGPPCLKLGGSKQARVLYSRAALERWVRETATPMGGIER